MSTSPDLDTSHSIRPKHQLRKRLILVGFSFGFACVVSEVGLRLSNYHPGTLDPQMYVSSDNSLRLYNHRPGYDGYCAGEKVTIDLEGNRIVTPSYSQRKNPGVSKPEKMVVLLGDSVVFGFGVADSKTLGSQLQTAVSSRNLNYEVSNIGVSGYTSWNELGALEDHLRKNAATDVVLFYISNDLTFDNDHFEIAKGKQASFSSNDSWRHRLLQKAYNNIYLTYLVSDSVKRLATSNAPQSDIAFNIQDKIEELRYSMMAVRRMNELCLSKNIRFQVAIYRDIAYASNQKEWLAYEATIKQELDAAGIKSFVAKAHLENLNVSEIRSSWSDPHPGPRAIGFIVQDILVSLN